MALDYLTLRRSIQKRGEEGRSTPVGYVPTDSTGKAIDNSGVTIGVGFDLGAHNVGDLKKMGFSTTIIKKLTPYLGLKGSDAQEVAKNLKVSGDDYIDIITRPINYKIDRIASKYNKKAGGNAFQRLDPALQETIFSTMYQMGIEGETGAPDFWKQATSGDWTGLYENLLDERPLEQGGWGRYADRRKGQAQKIWQSGAILRQSVMDEENRGKLFE